MEHTAGTQVVQVQVPAEPLTLCPAAMVIMQARRVVCRVIRQTRVGYEQAGRPRGPSRQLQVHL
jgi:hypothetical protein